MQNQFIKECCMKISPDLNLSLEICYVDTDRCNANERCVDTENMTTVCNNYYIVICLFLFTDVGFMLFILC